MRTNILTGPEEFAEARLRSFLIRNTGFRLACIIAGGNPRDLLKVDRAIIGELTARFIADVRKARLSRGLSFPILYQVSQLDPKNLSKPLTPREWYRQIGIDLETEAERSFRRSSLRF